MDTFNDIAALSIVSISIVMAFAIMGTPMEAPLMEAPLMEAPLLSTPLLSQLLNLVLVGGVAMGCVGMVCSVFALMMGTEEKEVSLTEAMEQAWAQVSEEIELGMLVSKHRHMLASLDAEVATSTNLVTKLTVVAIQVANGPQLQGRMHRPVLSALPRMRW